MKKQLVLCARMFLAACTPVKTTREYYEDYVNPKASIDYEASVSTDLPADFLDDYYTIDSKIVRLVDQIELMDERSDSDWIGQQKAAHPWIRHMAVLDGELLFLAGDDTLGFDPQLREGLAELSGEPRRHVLVSDGRVILVHVGSVSHDTLRTTLVEIDMDRLTEELRDRKTALFAGGSVYGQAAGVPAEALQPVADSSSYSGSRDAAGGEFSWVRSMASDNLIYIYPN
jgi:hypothetical protein